MAETLSPALFLATVTPDGSPHPQRSKSLRKTRFARDKDGGQETLTSDNLAAPRHRGAREARKGWRLCRLPDPKKSPFHLRIPFLPLPLAPPPAGTQGSAPGPSYDSRSQTCARRPRQLVKKTSAERRSGLQPSREAPMQSQLRKASPESPCFLFPGASSVIKRRRRF
nr:uncharacterized protein LOC120366777 [Saimiri boliviensis boliviensis]